jgi:hypothetical protein
MTRDERGQVGGIEAVVFGLLVLIAGTLIVSNAWGVVDAKMAAGAAAREAARTFVKAPAGSDPLPLALQAGHQTLASLGRDRVGARVELVSGRFTRCTLVTFRVTVPVPVIAIPWIRSIATGFSVVSTHSEVVDPYRSFIPGTGPNGSALCD